MLAGVEGGALKKLVAMAVVVVTLVGLRCYGDLGQGTWWSCFGASSDGVMC